MQKNQQDRLLHELKFDSFNSEVQLCGAQCIHTGVNFPILLVWTCLKSDIWTLYSKCLSFPSNLLNLIKTHLRSHCVWSMTLNPGEFDAAPLKDKPPPQKKQVVRHTDMQNGGPAIPPCTPSYNHTHHLHHLFTPLSLINVKYDKSYLLMSLPHVTSYALIRWSYFTLTLPMLNHPHWTF